MKPSTLRFKIVNIAFLVVAALIIFAIFDIQVSASAAPLLRWAQPYEQQTVMVSPTRGSIYDRWGNLLAGNQTVYEVGVDLNLVQNGNPETIAKVANEVLGIDYQLAKDIASIKYDDNHIYAVLQDFVTPEKIAQIEKLKEEFSKLPAPKDHKQKPTTLVGLTWTPHLMRTYPEGALGSNFLGFVRFMDRENAIANLGVEQFYDTILTGKPQPRLVTSNPLLIGDINPIPPGATLILTVDITIQASLEASLDKALKDSGADAGTILVLDPKTGEILGMANGPRFDINEYWKYGNLQSSLVFNRAVGTVYEPGSVFKVLTMGAAIDAGVVTPETTIEVPAVYEIDGIPIYNWDRGGWGTQSMIGCMQHSLNVCLAKVAMLLGPTRFYSYLAKFNVGQNSGVDIGGEAHTPLRLPIDTNWSNIDLGTNSFGQGVEVTPLQLAVAISSMANDGKIMAPHILRSWIIDGRQYNTPLQVVGSPVSAATAHTITNMLTISLEQEASSSLVDGYRVAGKTGTAEIFMQETHSYGSNLTNASFVGWGPIDDPRFLVYIWLEKPTKSRWGSEVAAPVFSEVFKNLVTLTNLPPDSTRLQNNGN